MGDILFLSGPRLMALDVGDELRSPELIQLGDVSSTFAHDPCLSVGQPKQESARMGGRGMHYTRRAAPCLG